jgi:hypothetical protein
MRSKLLGILAITLSGSALAAPSIEDTGPRNAYVGLQLGVVLPQLGSELDTGAGATFEAGVRAWLGLVPFVTVGYTQPEAFASGGDTRLLSGSYSAALSQRELVLTAGASWQWALGSFAAVFVGAGARAYLLETIATGSSGDAAFLEYRETSTRWGGVGLVGGELRFLSGAATLTLEIGGSPLPHRITGKVATTAIAVTVGYRLFIF